MVNRRISVSLRKPTHVLRYLSKDHVTASGNHCDVKCSYQTKLKAHVHGCCYNIYVFVSPCP